MASDDRQSRCRLSHPRRRQGVSASRRRLDRPEREQPDRTQSHSRFHVHGRIGWLDVGATAHRKREATSLRAIASATFGVGGAQRHGGRLHAGHSARDRDPRQHDSRRGGQTSTAAGESTSTKARPASWPRTTWSCGRRTADSTSTTAKRTSCETTSLRCAAKRRVCRRAELASQFHLRAAISSTGKTGHCSTANGTTKGIAMDRNLYSAHRRRRSTLRQADVRGMAGEGAGSRIRGSSDPLFMDPARDDFRFKPDSPATKMGILALIRSKAWATASEVRITHSKQPPHGHAEPGEKFGNVSASSPFSPRTPSSSKT